MSLESKISRLVGALRDRRYPTMVIVQGPEVHVPDDVIESVVTSQGLRRVNFRREILASEDSPVVLGAYLRNEFREWLREQALEAGGLLVEKADDLIGTWPEEERRAFFRDFLHLECKSKRDPDRSVPIVLVSRFPSSIELPTEEFGQGIVFDPAREREL